MLIPEWTERITDQDVVGEDHLGVETAATNYQDELIPGITTVTAHARYYSLYCWILWRFINDESQKRRIANLRGSYFKRLELAHTMGCHAHHLGSETLNGITGGRTAPDIWRAGDPISLDTYLDRYFQNTLGGMGQYYLVAMQRMGLLGEQPNAHDVYRLTTRGESLAQAFDQSIEDTRYHKRLASGFVTELSQDEAAEYGAAACLCPDALERGADRALLRQMLFRLEEAQDAPGWHRRRRLSLALLLDLARQSGENSLFDCLRTALYLGRYLDGRDYIPSPALVDTHARWSHVQARQLYSSALQILFATFLDVLQSDGALQSEGITFEEFIDHVANWFSPGAMDRPLIDDVFARFEAENLGRDWRQRCEDYCERVEFSADALTLFDTQRTNRGLTPLVALDMLVDVFLRFYPLHADDDPIWREMALSEQESHRLPLNSFFAEFESALDQGRTIRETLAWLYRDYVLAQHEYMAIRKLRYNSYDTFKFHYIDGRFYPPPQFYDQPLRHPSLRIDQALTMLIDVGLVQLVNGICALTPDGEDYLYQVEELNRGA